jgi:glutamate racemase
VAASLQDYLLRHADIAERAKAQGSPGVTYLTTESASKFAESASLFLAEAIEAKHIEL